MEILKREVFEINNKSFTSLEEAERYTGKLKKAKELIELAQPYMKDTYISLDSALEDAFIVLIDKNDKAMKILNHPIETKEPF